MTTVQTLLHFAYGSNMCEGRLCARVPSAHFVTVAGLPEHVLRFHKSSKDGSGKADAHRTGNQRDIVWGVVFTINDNEKPNLDEAEGLGKGYWERPVKVFGANGEVYTACMYYADKNCIEPDLKPYSWYKTFVVEGARRHRLPPDYIAMLENVQAKEDKNKERVKKNLGINC